MDNAQRLRIIAELRAIKEQIEAVLSAQRIYDNRQFISAFSTTKESSLSINVQQMLTTLEGLYNEI